MRWRLVSRALSPLSGGDGERALGEHERAVPGGVAGRGERLPGGLVHAVEAELAHEELTDLGRELEVDHRDADVVERVDRSGVARLADLHGQGLGVDRPGGEGVDVGASGAGGGDGADGV
jgi:hypothetical protein